MVLGIDPFVVLAVVLATAGFFGSFVPFVPGAVLSLAGVYTYWFSTGYTDPGAVVLALLTVVGVAVLAGSAGTVFLVEYHRSGDGGESLRTAGYTTLGILATTVMQALFTFGMLVALVAVIVV